MSVTFAEIVTTQVQAGPHTPTFAELGVLTATVLVMVLIYDWRYRHAYVS
jgi:hypothetical protein